ncbi:MAG TPA: YggS family pyridoxal phosphate-dependent enzyme [Chitinophagaceae bacterium]
MLINQSNFEDIVKQVRAANAVLVAVSKTKSTEAIKELYDLGQRDFGENYVQELVEKQTQLPQDIKWHFIGHLQSNKVKYIAPFIHLIHGVDSLKLLHEINKQAFKQNRIIQVLLQVHIAQEETKFGLDTAELKQILVNESEFISQLNHIHIKGLMGMASFTDNMDKVKEEFINLKSIYDEYKQYSLPNCKFDTLSMGMSSDYKVALAEGSTLIRIGSLLFGEREYQKA